MLTRTLAGRLPLPLACATLAIAWSLCGGCSTDGLSGRALAGACTLDSECTGSLVCTLGRCHTVCKTSKDCANGGSCLKVNGQSFCQLPQETPCEYDSECSAPLVCGGDGKCRSECMDARDCAAGQRCTAKVCVDPEELDAGRLPQRRDAGAGPVPVNTGGSAAAGGTPGQGGATASGGATPETGGSRAMGTGASGMGEGGAETGGKGPGAGGTGTGGAGGSGTGGAGGSGAGGKGAGGSGTGGKGTGGTSSGGASSEPDAQAMVTLTVENHLRWCTIQVDAKAPTTGAITTVTVPVGTIVHLSGAPLNGTFVWGYWTGTDGATSGKETNPMAIVTMNADKTVGACCPLSNDPTTPC